MSAPSSLPFPAGDSAMALLMRAHQWENSALGVPSAWPQSLRSVVDLMLGSAFPMFVAWGPSLHTLYNDAYAEILGAKHPQALGQPFYEVWQDIRARVQPLVERALGGEAFFVENLPLRMRRNGYDEDTWFTFSYSPVRDEAGVIAGLYCACTETTAMVLAERHQRAEQERLQTLFSQAPGFVALMRGPDHVFEIANHAYLRLAGFRDVVGKPVAQALPEVVEQGFLALLDKVFASGEPYVGRSVRLMLNGEPGAPLTEAFLDFVYQPLRGPTGRVEGVLVQGHEVTELQRALQALRAADRQKDEFLATLAHELRNPLAPIRAAAALLAAPGATEAARVLAADVITRQAGHMARLLDDLIDVARITQRRLVLRKERVSVQTLVDAALETVQPLAQAKQHQLTATVDTAGLQMEADPVRLVQILANLLHNASKYTDAGGRITLDVRSEGEALIFCVTDSGMGLSPEALDTIFTMFAQEQSALERSEGGLGIGLGLAKGLVELHGGTVTASSEGAGRGSRFVVRLPGARVSCEPLAQAPEAPVVATQPARPMTVLLADDNRDAAGVLAELLRMDGHLVHTVHDGREAAELASQLQPDVLVLDIGMPGLNGYEVAQHVRAQPWGQRPLLIAATGWGQDDDRQRAMAAGFNRHLTKPFDPQLLSTWIAEHKG